jgi:hypothetical protein
MMDVIITGQSPTGGFTYELNASARNDSSVMGWCCQALKAGKIAGLDSPGLDEAMKKGIEGFKGNYQGDSTSGGFGYTGPGRTLEQTILAAAGQGTGRCPESD